jgi:hypothetical protein
MSAESYVRRCAEDGLRDVVDEDEGRGSDLQDRVRALVVIGLLEADVATTILSSYGRARALRGLHTPGAYDDRQPVRAVEQRRVRGCRAEVEVSGTTVVLRHVSLSPSRTRLAVTLRFARATGSPAGRRHRSQFNGPPDLDLRDDKGRAVRAHFAGGGGGAEWRGWYEAQPGLSPDTAWIEVAGTRLLLLDAVAGASATVEDLTDDERPLEERAVRYLDQCVEYGHPGLERNSLAAVVDTLVSCGALSADSPAVAKVLNASGGPHSMAYPGSGPWIFQPMHGGRGPQKPTGSILVGMTTPSFDGVSITVTELESTPHGFRIEVDGSGPVEFGHGYVSRFDTPRLSFTATDDLGNRYRGSIAEFEPGDDEFRGSVEFEPTLDTKAAELDLAFTTDRARAIVHVPLRWDESG